MIIATSLSLPIGQRWQGRQGKIRRWSVQDPIRGQYAGPIFIVRAVSLDDYDAWCWENTGEPLTPRERTVLTSRRRRFYEIALD